MARKPKRRQCYYTVFALRDGAIVACRENKRKPLPSQRRGTTIDEDGVWCEHQTTAENFMDQKDRYVVLTQLAIANRLNTRRTLRELILPELRGLAECLARIEQRLDAVEERLAKRGSVA